VSKGAAYRVAAHDPLDWNEIPARGTSEPVVMEALELVLFVDNTVVTAYGRDGLAWQTERLVWDQLKVGRVDGSTLEAEGFDALADRIVSFTIDLRTGESVKRAVPAILRLRNDPHRPLAAAPTTAGTRWRTRPTVPLGSRRGSLAPRASAELRAS
jgi:hypothetical protein